MVRPEPGTVRILANCSLGIGFSRRGFALGLERKPDLIGCDGGSTDFGPSFLGSGTDPKSKASTERDLRIMMLGAHQVGAPLIIGSCGGAGARPHLSGIADVVKRVAASEGLHLKVGLIYADQAPESLHIALDRGRISPLGAFPDLTHGDISDSSNIVAMMGAGPIMQALDQGADIVLAGRCADPAIFAAEPLRRGLSASTVWHAAKSVDKGYLATTEPQRGSPVLVEIGTDSFIVEPMLPEVVCTPESVARVTMHENPNPFSIVQPSGSIMTANAKYESLDGRRVRVTGSHFDPTDAPSVKLEGARFVGYRAVMIAGIRDPRLLQNLDEFLEEYRALLERVVQSIGIGPEQWTVRFRCYGSDAILGALDPLRGQQFHEVGLVVDVVGETEEIATAIAGRSAAVGSRLDITGHLGGGGNFAYPFSPNVLRGGPVYEWSIWHVMTVEKETDPFAVEAIQL
jgi:hypothetical protein